MTNWLVQHMTVEEFTSIHWVYTYMQVISFSVFQWPSSTSMIIYFQHHIFHHTLFPTPPPHRSPKLFRSNTPHPPTSTPPPPPPNNEWSIPYISSTIQKTSIIPWIMVQSYTVNDLILLIGHCDLYFMVHWFCLISPTLFSHHTWHSR